MKKISNIIITIFIISFGFFIFSSFRNFDPDLWGHLKFGEYIINNGIPLKDVFSYALTKPIWVNHEWLSEVVFYHLTEFNRNGVFLLLFKALIFILTIIFPWLYVLKLSNNKNIVIIVLIFLVSIMVLSYGTAIRPQIFSYLFFSLTLFLLEKYGLKSSVTTFLLAVIFICWVNFHGGVIAGLVLVYYYALCELFKNIISNINNKNKDLLLPNEVFKILLVPFLLTLTLLINPYSLYYLSYIVDAILMSRPFVDEWQSILIVKINYTFIYILLAISIIIIIDSFRKLNSDKLSKIILLLILLTVSILHTRHFPFFAILCSYYLPVLIINNYKVKPSDNLSNNNKSYKLLKYIVLLFLILISCTMIYKTVFKEEKFDYTLKISLKSNEQYVGFPLQSTVFIIKHKIRGNLLTDFNWGEFAIYQLYPGVKIAMDGRYETVYPEQTVKDYIKVINAKPGWKKLLEDSKTNLVLTSISEPITKKLLKDNHWNLIYKDFEAYLFLKSPDR